MLARTFLALALVTTCLLGANAQDEAPAEAQGDSKKDIGYFLGLNVGQQMHASGFRLADFDVQSFLAGYSDGLSEKESALTEAQLKATETIISELLVQRRQALVEDRKKAGIAWLAENGKKEGVKTLERGLQYKVLKEGKGDSPKPTDRVKVHYTGKLIDGTVFDSSVSRGQPASFGVTQVISGWTMALQKMKVGDKWMLYIPSELGYGERGSPGAIGPNEVLVFEVELLEIL